MPSFQDIEAVAPALAKYAQEKLLGEVWKRPQLSLRDRSIITISALIARSQTIEMPFYLGLALDNAVTPAEVSEIITHLAFYSGWANAMSAVGFAKVLFAERGVQSNQLPKANPNLLPIEPKFEQSRAERVQQDAGPVSPGLVQYTGAVLFHELWLRPDLAPRDRSLVTLSALIASGQVAQVTFHLNRAMDNGLTKEQAGEILTHIAFYAGWPNAMSAVPVFREVMDKRGA